MDDNMFRLEKHYPTLMRPLRLLKELVLENDMDTMTLQPDTPFRSGVSGKYKLLTKTVEFRYGNYEYDLSMLMKGV